jgi:hypothetical protein
MTPLDQYLTLITPVATVTAVLSGIAFALVIHALRPTADARLITFLTVVLSVLWYLPQWAALFFTEGTGWATLGRWTLFLVGFVLPMWATLRWRAR